MKAHKITSKRELAIALSAAPVMLSTVSVRLERIVKMWERRKEVGVEDGKITLRQSVRGAAERGRLNTGRPQPQQKPTTIRFTDDFDRAAATNAMIYNCPDNTLGPDPREDDPTPIDRVLSITITLQYEAEYSNRDAEDEECAIIDRITKALDAAGFPGANVDLRE